MTSERIKQIQETTAYHESVSVKNALLQVWNECGQEYEQQLSSEREAHKKEIERILSAVARGEKLANSLNFDGKSELDKERERAGKLVSALRSISAYTEDNFIQQKANQTLNEYDTATKES